MNNINYTAISFITLNHIISLYGLINIKPHKFDILFTIFMYAITGFSITLGYHRLWSHRTFKTVWPIKCILAFFGAGASQGSIIWWSKYHRLHHYKTDTEDDPYGPQNGFLYSHIGWIIHNRTIDKLKQVDISDLKSDPIIRFQHKNYVVLSLASSICFPILSYYLTNKLNNISDLIRCIVYPVSIARIITWHSTWFVNSLAHWLGTQDHGTSTSSRNHIITALLTLGEGYHNYHHEYQYDYRNGINFHDYDPTKWLIESLEYFNLAYDLKTKEKLFNTSNSTYKYKNLLYELSYDDYIVLVKAGEKLILIDNIIYDVSNFIDNHPGGAKYIKYIIGKDSTYIKEQILKINNHTASSMKLLDNMKYGILH